MQGETNADWRIGEYSVIRTHISALKQKLSISNCEYIKNVWGVGYRFNKAEGER